MGRERHQPTDSDLQFLFKVRSCILFSTSLDWIKKVLTSILYCLNIIPYFYFNCKFFVFRKLWEEVLTPILSHRCMSSLVNFPNLAGAECMGNSKIHHSSPFCRKTTPFARPYLRGYRRFCRISQLSRLSYQVVYVFLLI